MCLPLLQMVAYSSIHIQIALQTRGSSVDIVIVLFSPYSPGWPGSQDPSASASHVLGLQLYVWISRQTFLLVISTNNEMKEFTLALL